MTISAVQLPGLPPYGDAPRTFSATGLQTFREGLVVKVSVGDSLPWVGNFIPGMGSLDLVCIHPNEKDVLVISGGQAYVVNAVTGELIDEFGGAIADAFHLPSDPKILIINHQNISFEAIGANGRLWDSDRISWDGFRVMKVVGDTLLGEAWSYDDSWHPFELDLKTGRFTGGAYI